MKQARDYRKYNVRLTSADWQRGSDRVINNHNDCFIGKQNRPSSMIIEDAFNTREHTCTFQILQFSPDNTFYPLHKTFCDIVNEMWQLDIVLGGLYVWRIATLHGDKTPITRLLCANTCMYMYNFHICGKYMTITIELHL